MKLTSIILVALCIAGTSSAQHVQEHDVPAAIKQALNQKYPGIIAKKWTKEKDVYEAEVMLEAKASEVAFDAAGKWLETEREITNHELPQAVSKAIATSEYKAWSLKEAEAIQSPDYELAYEVELKQNKKKVALLFTPEGKLISTEKD